MSDSQTGKAPAVEPQPQTPPAATAGGPRSRGPSSLQIGIVVAILGGGILLTALTSDVTRTSEPGIRLVDDHPYLPEQAGEWRGGELQGLTEAERNILPSDTEGARRVYTDAAGHQVYCSVVLAGRDVTSIHRPELCLTGQGWNLEAPAVERISTPAVPGGVVKVSRMNATHDVQSADGKTGKAQAVFVYWFAGKDRTTPHHWQRILWTTEDRVLHNRNHRWAYFLINAPVAAEGAGRDYEAVRAETMQTIARFVESIYPALMATQSSS